MPAEIAKLQQQHATIVSENKKMAKELTQLAAAVSTDQSGQSIARLDKQLEKLSSAHKEFAGKQDKTSAEHDKVVSEVGLIVPPSGVQFLLDDAQNASIAMFCPKQSVALACWWALMCAGRARAQVSELRKELARQLKELAKEIAEAKTQLKSNAKRVIDDIPVRL